MKRAEYFDERDIIAGKSLLELFNYFTFNLEFL